jgi:hypothetical protein
MPKLLANQPEIRFFQRDCPKPIIVAGFRSLDFHPEVHLALADFHVVYACHFAAENWTGNVCGEGDTFANSAPLRTKFQGVLPRGGLNILKSCKNVSFLAAKRMVWTQKEKNAKTETTSWCQRALAEDDLRKIQPKWCSNNLLQGLWISMDFAISIVPWSPKTRPGSPTEVLPAWWPSTWALAGQL